MNREVTFISGLGLGAAAMYILDPDRGRRRRALVRDKLTHVKNRAPGIVDSTARDVKNRAQGVVAGARSMFKDEVVDDEVLEARVRSCLGRVTSHPHSIKVSANYGKVTLSGPILSNELSKVLSAVSSVRGAVDIDNRLEVHESAHGVPSLQGGRSRRGDRFEFLQTNWSPTARLMAGAAGGALTLLAIKQNRFPVSCALGTIGALLIGRGSTNLGFTRLLGIDSLRNAIAKLSESVEKANVEPGGTASEGMLRNVEREPPQRSATGNQVEDVNPDATNYRARSASA